MKFNLCFKQTRTYYDHETIEAESLEDAEALAARLIENDEFQMHVDDVAEYEDAEYCVNEECRAWKVSDDCEVTLSKRDIEEYID